MIDVLCSNCLREDRFGEALIDYILEACPRTGQIQLYPAPKLLDRDSRDSFYLLVWASAHKILLW